MTVLCYFKPASYQKLVTTDDPKDHNKEHLPTGLSAPSDGEGYYAVLHVDLYQRPEYVLRPDLEPDIAWFSAKVQVDHESYTADKSIATGNYTCDDPDVILVISRQIINLNGVLHREMKVKAPTWEQLKLAVEKIRQGKITPVGREQTVLEVTLAELAQTRSNLQQACEETLTCREALHATQVQNAEHERVINWCTNFLSNRPYELRDSELAEQPKFSALRKEVVASRNATSDLALMKTTRWYWIYAWYYGLNDTNPG